MKILVQRYRERDGDYVPGSIRIAVVTDESVGKCPDCKCPLYASITWEPSGTQVFSHDLGKHKKNCENRSAIPVVMRTIKD
jgi:hypothetical protein